jgi:hypothetical protein
MTAHKEFISEHTVQRMTASASIPTARQVHTLEHAALKKVMHLAMMGASLIVLRARSKIPVESNWTTVPRLKWVQFKKKYRAELNIGVRLGEPSKIDGLYLHVIDLDIRISRQARQALKKLKKLLPGVNIWSLPCVRSGSGGESRHFYFLTKVPYRSKKLAHSGEKFTDKDGKQHWTWEIELFGTGKQIALPPSIHPCGNPYRWEREFDETAPPPYISDELIESLVNPTEDDDDYETEKLGCSYADVEEALIHLDIDYWCEDREGWIRLGMALHHEFDGAKAAFEVWCDYSRNSRKFDRAVQWQQWKSFDRGKPEKPVRMATVFKASHEARRDAEYRALPSEFDELEAEFTATTDDLKDFTLPAIPRQELYDAFEDLVKLMLPANAEVEGIPKHLLSVPGVLQKLVDYYNATAVRPQPQFAVQTALAFASVVLGRMWSTDDDNYTSLYFMNVAPTAAGKEHARKVIGRALDASRLGAFMGPKVYASEGAVLGRLKEQPKHITVMDETGRYMSSARKSGNGNKQDAQTVLMEVFGTVDETIRGISYSTRGMTKEQIEEMMNTEITRPALTILGMTTPATLYDAIGGMDVKDGFLNRFIIVQSEIGRQKRRRGLGRPDIPQEVIEWAKEHAFRHGGDADDDDRTLIDPKFVPPPVIVPFSKGAMDLLGEIEDEVMVEMTRAEPFGMDDLFGRTQEIAQRVSLIIAGSERSDTVKVSHVQWAWEYVRYYHRQMVELFKVNLGKSEGEAIAEEVARFLKKRGAEGATSNEIAKYVRSFRALDPARGREDILLRAQSDYGVRHTVSEGKGPKTKRYFAAKR